MTALLFVGGYSPANQIGLRAFAMDETTGALTPSGTFAGIANTSFLVVHPNGRWLYAVSETAEKDNGTSGEVWALRYTRAPMHIKAINPQLSGGTGPCHLQFDATHQWLFVANYGSGSARVFPVHADGSLGAPTGHVQHGGSGPNSARQEGPHAHSTIVTPDNRYAIVADLGLDQLLIYAFDAATGALTAHGQMTARPGAGPRHMAFHSNGRVLYAANELDNTVSVCDYDAASGTVREVQTLATLPAPMPESSVADIHFSAATHRLYVSNRGHDSLAVYQADAAGRLTHLATTACGGRCPRNFALAPGGRFIVVANQLSHEIAVLPLTVGATEVGEGVARAAASGAACIQFAQ